MVAAGKSSSNSYTPITDYSDRLSCWDPVVHSGKRNAQCKQQKAESRMGGKSYKLQPGQVITTRPKWMPVDRGRATPKLVFYVYRIAMGKSLEIHGIPSLKSDAEKSRVISWKEKFKQGCRRSDSQYFVSTADLTRTKSRTLSDNTTSLLHFAMKHLLQNIGGCRTRGIVSHYYSQTLRID